MKIKKDCELTISIVIPTYNSAKWLPRCLRGIMNQNYPFEKIEIIISDGGSTDDTLAIAKKLLGSFNFKILHNKKKLAEPGVSLGLKNASNQICTILAVDNILKDESYLRKISKTLCRDDIFAAFATHLYTNKDNWYTKYWNVFTDPFNHFVYGNAANCRTFKKIYKVLEKNDDYMIFEFDINNYPMLAFAQGFTLKNSYIRERKSANDDLLPVIDLIKKRKKMAYVYTTGVVHHSVNDLKNYIKKQKWAVNNFLIKADYGINSRKSLFSPYRKARMYIWPFYAISFVAPLLRGVYGSVKDRNSIWLYHPFINFLTVLIVTWEVVKVKILKSNKIIERQ